MRKQSGSSPREGSVEARAAALLAAARKARAMPCRVGRSPHRKVVDAMLKQRGSAKLIEKILREQLGDPISYATLARHNSRKCMCYRDRYHQSSGPS